MANKKIEKALYGPGAFEIILGVVLSLLLGVLAACAYLVFKPAQAVKVMPAQSEQVAGTVYYLAGENNPSKARELKTKQKSLTAGAEIILNEAELNAWAATLKAPAAPATATPAKPAEAKPATTTSFLSATDLNFRLQGSEMQISAQVTFNYFGILTQALYLTRGTIAQNDGTYVFQPTESYLGSCPLHHLPIAQGAFYSALLKSQTMPEDLATAWPKLTKLSVEDGLLHLVSQP